MTELSFPHYYCNDGGEVRLAKYNRWYEFYEPTLEPLSCAAFLREGVVGILKITKYLL